jgi:GMP synthase PP-ATPase subunit
MALATSASNPSQVQLILAQRAQDDRSVPHYCDTQIAGRAREKALVTKVTLRKLLISMLLITSSKHDFFLRLLEDVKSQIQAG